MTLGLSNGPKHAARRAKEARVSAPVADLFPETKPDASPDEAFDERYTTRETLEWCKARAGVDAFDLDVAACAESHHAARYFTKADDGLSRPWTAERVWLNPPYSDISPWVTKAWEEIAAGRCRVIAMLIPATRTEQSWWVRDVEPHRDGRGAGQLATHFLPGRTAFARPGSGGVGQSGAPFGCVLLVFVGAGWKPKKRKLHIIDVGGES